MKLPRYFIVAELPVKLVSAGLGIVQVFKYNPLTNQFDHGLEYLLRIAAGVDVREVSEEEFQIHLETLQYQNGSNRSDTVYE